MTAAWRIRPLRNTKTDRGRLRAFACATTPAAWQHEVESFIRSALFDWAFEPLARSQDPRVLLMFHARSLVGVAAHERTMLHHGNRAPFAATKLEVIAVASSWQGRAFTSGERVSDILLSAALTDVAQRVPPRDARIFAVIHEDNTRSIALARRHGFTAEMSRPHPAYRRLLTGHRR